MSTTDDETVESLREEIKKLEDAIKEKKAVATEKQKALKIEEIDHSEAARKAKEAEQALFAAQRECKEATDDRQAILPQYENCQQNKDQHAKAEAYKKEIKETEEHLRNAEATIQELEKELQAVSADYKTERERRALLADRLSSMVDEVRGAVEEKVALTLPVDESNAIPHAKVSFHALAENTRERETSISQCARHAHELAAMVELKQQRATELRIQAEHEIASLQAAKDEQLKALIMRHQEERAALQGEIDSIKQVNRQQNEELRRTKIISDAPAIASAREPSSASKRSTAADAEAVLGQKQKDLVKEKESLQKKLKDATAEKHRLMIAMKDLRTAMDHEHQKHSQSIANLDKILHREKNMAQALEKENLKLEDMCDVLQASIQSSLLQLEAPPAANGSGAN